MHGREAYRRNSLLVLYNFYKNILYVSTQFYFGFYAGFSGQMNFEKFLHQFYNFPNTALPIVWYAVQDFQYERLPPAKDGNKVFDEADKNNKSNQKAQ